MSNVHPTLSQMWNAGVYEPSIHHIRFPLYKNLAPGTKIEFTHPVTALVGANGTNKSSVLRALQGCPGNNNLGLYWFGTALDAIPKEERHRFIYGRLSTTTGTTVEVVKTRIARPRKKLASGKVRREDPDYWEPSRPLLSEPDLMERYPPKGLVVPSSDGAKTRWNTVTMDVLYLDFRSELSAFDVVFHHGYLPNPNVSSAQAQNSRKASIRTWAPRLKAAITNSVSTDTKYNSERIITAARDLGPSELAAVGEILGRTYQSITVIQHRYFGKTDGWTAVLRSDSRDYTEAFAGSGEFAIVMLVMKVMSAERHTLILLDEPEVSLHPSAQLKVMEFLAEQAKSKLHQVVLATHSAEIIRYLPAEAIKVLNRDVSTGLVEVPMQACPPNVAFEAIGAMFEHPAIVVEDDLAKVVVQHAIANEPWAGTLNVLVRRGGADRIWTWNIPDWAVDNRSNILVYFDGDQECPAPYAGSDLGDAVVEKEVRLAFNDQMPRVIINGGDSASHGDEKLTALRGVLDWRRENVAFLPFNDPESFVYRHATDATAMQAGDDVKKLWTQYVFERQAGPDQPTSVEILGMQKQVLNKIDINAPEFTTIRNRLKQFVDRSNV